MSDLLFAGAGLVLLLVAGDLLVRGAVAISLRLGIPALIVSLTIVAFGTSAPELLIAIQAALSGAPGLALGNVIGSNIANVLLVLGVPAVIAGLNTAQCDTRSSYTQMIGATVVFIVLLFLGPLKIWHGVVLLTLLAAMIGKAIADARAARAADAVALSDEVAAAAEHPLPAWRSLLYLVAGMAGLPLGADLLVDGARHLAVDFGVSDEVIGLTLVAIGTSLPELATTVVAALRKQADVAIGNVIGSNLLNLLAIMGVTSLFGPLVVDEGLLQVDIWVMLGASLLLLPFVFMRWNIGRTTGIVFIFAYSAYMLSLF
ncbi:MAG: calcium/sodium antiporter [Pseudomonadota bacterium]